MAGDLLVVVFDFKTSQGSVDRLVYFRNLKVFPKSGGAQAFISDVDDLDVWVVSHSFDAHNRVGQLQVLVLVITELLSCEHSDF